MKRRPLLQFRRAYAKCVLILFVLLWSCTGAWTYQVDMGSDMTLDWETTLTYGMGMRAADQDRSSINADINRDDGNRSFEQWDMINNRFSILTEANLRTNGFGAFVRGSAFYDSVYMGKNQHDSPSTHNAFVGNGGSLQDHRKFNGKVKNSVGRDAELLDAYVYADFDITENPTTIRVGRQVVNWGESLLLIGGIGTSQNPLDATKANTPGAELRELFLPTGQVYAQQTLFDAFTFSGFYKWEWERTRLNEAGTFFSTEDILLEAAETILVDVGIGQNLSIDHRGIEDASDDGQWGAGIRYYAENLNGAEFGLYYMNYHETFPMVKFRPTGGSLNSPDGTSWTNFIPSPDGDTLDFIDGSSYYFDYAEDVQLLSFSATSQVGAASYALEVVYRWDYPVEIIDTDPFNLLGVNYEDGEILHAALNGYHLWGRTFLSDTGALLWEVGYNKAYGIPSSKLSYDKEAWGAAAEINFEYLQIIDGLDLTVAIPYAVNPHGTSSYVGSFIEDNDSVGIAFKFIYNAVYKVDLSYTNFLHDTGKHAKADRDWFGLNVKYTF